MPRSATLRSAADVSADTQCNAQTAVESAQKISTMAPRSVWLGGCSGEVHSPLPASGRVRIVHVHKLRDEPSVSPFPSPARRQAHATVAPTCLFSLWVLTCQDECRSRVDCACSVVVPPHCGARMALAYITARPCGGEYYIYLLYVPHTAPHCNGLPPPASHFPPPTSPPAPPTPHTPPYMDTHTRSCVEFSRASRLPPRASTHARSSEASGAVSRPRPSVRLGVGGNRQNSAHACPPLAGEREGGVSCGGSIVGIVGIEGFGRETGGGRGGIDFFVGSLLEGGRRERESADPTYLRAGWLAGRDRSHQGGRGAACSRTTLVIPHRWGNGERAPRATC